MLSRIFRLKTGPLIAKRGPSLCFASCEQVSPSQGAAPAGGAAHPHEFLNRLPDSNLEFGKYAKGERKLELYPDRNGFFGFIKFMNALRKRR